MQELRESRQQKVKCTSANNLGYHASGCVMATEFIQLQWKNTLISTITQAFYVIQKAETVLKSHQNTDRNLIFYFSRNCNPVLRFLLSEYNNRDLKVVVYRKRLTSDTLFAIKTNSLTVKYFTYRIYLKYRKLRIQTLCLTTETWRLI